MSDVIRFRRKPYRFRVSKNSVSVYKRKTGWDIFGPFDTELLVTPQHAGQLKKKYALDISNAQKQLR